MTADRVALATFVHRLPLTRVFATTVQSKRITISLAQLQYLKGPPNLR